MITYEDFKDFVLSDEGLKLEKKAVMKKGKPMYEFELVKYDKNGKRIVVHKFP